jgi:hypothetical protein
MPDAVLLRLETIEKALRPADPVQANAWLFDEMFPDLPVPTDEKKDRRSEFRIKAVREIHAAKGMAGILELAADARQAGAIVDSLAAVVQWSAPRDLERLELEFSASDFLGWEERSR